MRHWQPAAYTEAHAIAHLTMTVHWDDKEDEPLCLISTLTPHEAPHRVYEMRFWIETLFGQHKSRGFALDRTQMTTPENIGTLTGCFSSGYRQLSDPWSGNPPGYNQTNQMG